ncbi:hypothetical protein BE221DRAFT_117077 [Ostreococcus tauri]|uniref:Uncharacterized protein n=1 Tax=Ostreococcus tauri TaxID=70448 RepID=A0A1Y5I5T8_OSTTA|nr:hypothetical protein BE221DRAFT_117077 [Ostreococcus tauri]
MEGRIGFDRPSMAMNALINNRADVGRARETMIFAPDGARGGAPARRAAAAPSETAGDALVWRDPAVGARVRNAYTGGIDLMAMNKRATSEGKCVTSKQVRAFRRAAKRPTLLRSGERRARPTKIDDTLTFGRPSAMRSEDETRWRDAPESIADVIEHRYADAWIEARRMERARASRARASSHESLEPRAASSAKTSTTEDARAPFKMKRFAEVPSKVAAMGFF